MVEVARRMGKVFVALIVTWAVLGAATTAQAGVRYTTKYKHYAIKGKTSLELVLFMGRYGPMVGHQRAYGTIHPNPDVDGKLQQLKNRCAIKNFSITYDFVITLPKVNNRKSMTRRARKLFARFYGDTKRHEHTHRAIYLKCARRADKRIRALRNIRQCGRLDSAIGVVIKEEFAKCEAAHKAFDRREARGLAKEPLIKQALKESRKNKKSKINRARGRTILRGMELTR